MSRSSYPSPKGLCSFYHFLLPIPSTFPFICKMELMEFIRALDNFSMDPTTPMLAKWTIKAKPSQDPTLALSLPTSHSFFFCSPCFFWAGREVLHGFPQSHTFLNSTAIWLFSHQSIETALAKVTNNLPDSMDTCQSSSYLSTAISDSTNHFLPLKVFSSLAFMMLLCLGFSFSSLRSPLLIFPHRFLFLNYSHFLELEHVCDGRHIPAFSLLLTQPTKVTNFYGSHHSKRPQNFKLTPLPRCVLSKPPSGSPLGWSTRITNMTKCSHHFSPQVFSLPPAFFHLREWYYHLPVAQTRNPGIIFVYTH